MNDPEAKRASKLRRQAQLWVKDNEDSLFEALYGETPDFLSRAIASALFVDMMLVLDIDLDSYPVPRVQAIQMMVLGYLEYYADHRSEV